MRYFITALLITLSSLAAYADTNLELALKLETTAKDAVYISDSIYPWTAYTVSLAPDENLSEETLRRALGIPAGFHFRAFPQREIDEFFGNTMPMRACTMSPT